MKTKYFFRLLGICLLTGVLAGPASALTIKLQNGDYLQGEITRADEAGFDFQRWDNGGVVTLKWENLPPEESERLRTLAKVKIISEEIDGQRFYMKNTEIIVGVVEEETAAYLNVKTVTGVKKVLKEYIVGSDPVKLNAMDVYTPAELYDLMAKKYDLSRAGDCFQFADYCLNNLGLLDKARELYTKAAELDETYREKALESLKKMNQDYLNGEIKKINDLLDKNNVKESRAALEKLKGQNDFKKDPEAQKVIKQTEQHINEVEKAVGDQSTKDSVKKVVNECYKALDAQLTKVAANNTLSYSDMTDYVNRNVLNNMLKEAAKNLEMTDKDVQKIWNARTLDISTKRTVSYGDGSFIISSAPPPPSSDNIDEFAAYKDKMRAIADATTAARTKNPSPILTADSWWKKANQGTRQTWLTAYFAEHSMKVVETKNIPCANCRGEGVFSKGVNKVGDLCPRCQGATVDRAVTYY